VVSIVPVPTARPFVEEFVLGPDQRVILLGEGRLIPGRIAAGGFDLDHIHPQVPQQLAAERPHGGGQVEHVKSR
jgi:hypothetical protein